MKRAVTLTLLLFTFFTAAAQRKQIDSLKKLLAAAPEDTTKALLYGKLGGLYLDSKPDSAMLFSRQEEQLSRKLNFLRGEASAINNEGNVFGVTGNYPKALSFYLAALKIDEKRNKPRAIAAVLSNIGAFYGEEGDYRQGINYYLRAKKLAESVHADQTLSVELLDLGDSYEKLDILDSALAYTQEGYSMSVKIKDADLTGAALNNLGNIYVKMHKPGLALYNYRKGIPYLVQAGDDDAICVTTLGMAKIFRQQGQQDSAMYYARRSIAAGWHGGFTPRVLAASQFLSTYFKEQGRLDSAYHYLEVSVTAKDSLYSQEKTRAVQNLSFAERQRQEDIAEQGASNRAAIRFYLLMAVIVFLVVMAVVFWRNNRRKEKANRLLSKQKQEIEEQRDQTNKALAELKLTQNQLVQSAKMASLGELTAGIAHEIQNPLNFVNNFSEVSVELLDEMDGELDKGDIQEAKAIGTDLKQNLQKIQHHGKRADFIVKGMLEHSRTNTGEKQLTDMNVLCDEFLKLSYHGLRAKDKSFNAEMVTHFDSKLPKINVSQQDMGRVMLNLFNNAFYAVNQKLKTAGADYKPEVTVTTFTPPPGGGGWGGKVKDNGVGIPDAIKDKIMQPFFTTKPTGEGTGLGLSLTYDMVVKGHGGSIQVDSLEGEGSEFTIILPAN
ncbi:MAG TPA: ATP-binding protein [Mucilaginibacter sp.]|jgi:signal transduction histidine kinase|nr:ATP-binding protein [Mucilaginibacter sp.]